MLKKAIRWGMRKGRAWLREGSAPVPVDGHAMALPPNTAYESLNPLFFELTAMPRSRPHFAWGMLFAANMAKALKIDRISAIEFGVAGGNGLVSLEDVAGAIGKRLNIQIDVFGFDTGKGLPRPMDYRDLPNIFREGSLAMDQERLRRRLKTARLVLGPVEETIGTFIDSRPAPVGFVSFDLDYYSSTMHAFKLLDANDSILLPRIHCYFDDVLGFTYSEFTGERLAISEFNECHAMRKISPIFGLNHFLPSPHHRAAWADQMFLAHIFDHRQYGEYDGLIERYDGRGFNLVEDDNKTQAVASVKEKSA
jgi:hypothetical protein